MAIGFSNKFDAVLGLTIGGIMLLIVYWIMMGFVEEQNYIMILVMFMIFLGAVIFNVAMVVKLIIFIINKYR